MRLRARYRRLARAGKPTNVVCVAIARELGLPIQFVGVGEKIEDLRPFDPASFVEALYTDASGPPS